MRLPEDPRVREALGLAMKRLAARARFSGELERDLLSKGYTESEAGEALSVLQAERLLDDRSAAHALIESRGGKRSVGADRFRELLTQRGCPEEIVEEVLAVRSPDEELEGMLEALKTKSWRDRSQAARFLFSRGFDQGLIESALDQRFGSQD